MIQIEIKAGMLNLHIFLIFFFCQQERIYMKKEYSITVKIFNSHRLLTFFNPRYKPNKSIIIDIGKKNKNTFNSVFKIGKNLMPKIIGNKPESDEIIWSSECNVNLIYKLSLSHLIYDIKIRWEKTLK